MEWLTFVVVDPVKAMLVKIWSYIPSMVGAIVVLIVGWMLAKLVEGVFVRVLKTLKLDLVSDKTGISNVLAQGDIKATLSELIGGIVYWLIILVVLATALNALNLSIAADLISRMVSYIPSIIGAIFILVLGSMLANFVGTIVHTSAKNAGMKNANALSQLTQTLVVIFAVIIAIEQLKVASALIILSVNVILMSLGLGIALAFGLGCKDIAGKFVQETLNNLKK